MRIGFVVYDGMTALDFVGAYDPLVRLRWMGFLPQLTWEICARTATVRDHSGLEFAATAVGTSLGAFDVVVVPGGLATRTLLADAAFLDWIRTAAPCPLKASVCTGSLLLGAAGFLAGKRATTHPTAYAQLAPYCAQVVDERVVDEGEVVTARGVTSALDLGLHLCERLAGSEARTQIARQMDYVQATKG